MQNAYTLIANFQVYGDCPTWFSTLETIWVVYRYFLQMTAYASDSNVIMIFY